MGRLFKLKLANFSIKSILEYMRNGSPVIEIVAGGALLGTGLVVSAIGYGLVDIATRDGQTLDRVSIHGKPCYMYPNVSEEIGGINDAQDLVDRLGGVTSRVCYSGDVWYSTGN
jgi:hypothetical protein